LLTTIDLLGREKRGMQRLLSVKEVSELLNVKPSSIYKRSRLGKIPCVRFGSLLRFSEAAVLAWLQEGKAAEPVVRAS
jgi:excisionase family DNA binding protein